METLFGNDGIGAGAELVRWDELTSVAIRTTADGPFCDDVFWQFLTPTRLFEIPSTFVRGDDLEVMQKHLAGMNHESVMRAMCSTEDRVFAVWSSGCALLDGLGERFRALVARLSGDATAAAPVFEVLHAAWSAPERRYHTLAHLGDCLAVLDTTQSPAALADVAELALFYHDAVYAPTAADNEEKSAEMLMADAAALGLTRDLVTAACACILGTKHTAERAGSDASDLVNDCDLAILGSDPLRFLDYEHGIREEFAHVTWWRFVIARGRILDAFLERAPLYQTQACRDRYEAAARRNLSGLLQSPRYRVYGWAKKLGMG